MMDTDGGIARRQIQDLISTWETTRNINLKGNIFFARVATIYVKVTLRVK